MNITQIMQAINAVSKKTNDFNNRLDDALGIKSAQNAESAADAQNATIDLGLELDQRLADIENALCEISEE